MARLTLVLLGFWPCIGIRRLGLEEHDRSPARWASGAVLVLSNHVSWLDILVRHRLYASAQDQARGSPALTRHRCSCCSS